MRKNVRSESFSKRKKCKEHVGRQVTEHVNKSTHPAAAGGRCWTSPAPGSARSSGRGSTRRSRKPSPRSPRDARGPSAPGARLLDDLLPHRVHLPLRVLLLVRSELVALQQSKQGERKNTQRSLQVLPGLRSVRRLQLERDRAELQPRRRPPLSARPLQRSRGVLPPPRAAKTYGQDSPEGGCRGPPGPHI